MSGSLCVHCGVKATRATAKFCFGCGNKLNQTHEGRRIQQRSKCVLCRNELETVQPFCDECGADQKAELVLKLFGNSEVCSR